MNDNLIKHELADEVLKNVLKEDAAKADFSKYKKNNMSTSWLYMQDKSAKWILQLNINNRIYGGFATEPYKLFLSHAKEFSIIAIKLQNSFNTKIVNSWTLNNFKLEFIEQNTFDVFLLSKINCIVFLIMAVESYVNAIIPYNFSLNDEDINTIEKKYSLRQKFHDIIPKIKQIDDIVLYQNKYSQILNLNELRHNFIHVKTSNSEITFDSFIKDYEDILKLDIENEYLIIEDFIQMINQYQDVK